MSLIVKEIDIDSYSSAEYELKLIDLFINFLKLSINLTF
jgi:hypothetical protein